MYEIYTVANADTVESIADAFNISPANLYKLNGFNPDFILQPQMNIIVPKVSNAYFEYYTVKKGDNLYRIAKEYGVDENLLAILNGLNKTDYIYPNQTIVIPQKGVGVYITQQGDTINGIAQGINANLLSLLSQNPQIYLMSEQIIEWLLCPICNSKTRIKLRCDTILEKFPLFCPKCKMETLISVKELHTTVIKEPDAKTQSR